MKKDSKREVKVKLWGDVVSMFDLVISILIITTMTMSLFFLAPQADRSSQLVYGLAGTIIGFGVSVLVIKPKRNVKELD